MSFCLILCCVYVKCNEKTFSCRVSSYMVCTRMSWINLATVRLGGAYVGVRLTSEGSMWRVDSSLIDNTEVTTVLLGVIRSGGQWQSDLTRLVVTTLSCVNSVSQLSVVCVDEHLNVGRAIGSVAVPTLPVVMRVFDRQ